MKYISLFFSAFLLSSSPVFSETPGWTINPFEQKVFIENKGQFDKKKVASESILFGVNNLGYQLYFSQSGFTIRHDITEIAMKEEDGKVGENESDEDKLITTTKTVTTCYEWLDISPYVKITPSDISPGLFSYAAVEGWTKEISNCKAYKKLLYQNIYEGIDLEFIFHPQAGIKYSFILHPGADASKIKMKCVSGNEQKLLNGKIHLNTEAGEVIEEAPVTFYQGNHEVIQSEFVLNNNVVSFHLGPYDHSRTIIIDPWVIMPSLPAGGANNRALEVQKDPAGNVYVYGYSSPFTSFYLNKYDPAGTFVWSFALPFTQLNGSGDLWVDDNGFAYVNDGYISGATTGGVVKVNKTGTAAVWVNGFGNEQYRIVPGCDKSKFYTAGGTTGASIVREIDTATGAITGSFTVPVAGPELKTIARAPNGNYYFITNENCQCLFAANSSFNAVLWNTPSGYTYPYWFTSYLVFAGGWNYIAVNNKFIYTYNGILLLKKDICNGALLASVNVPSGKVHMDGGLMLDSCGNVYVGSMNGIYKYDANLAQIAFDGTVDTVFDISAGINPGELLACGNRFVASINMSVCQPVPFPPVCPAVFTASVAVTNPACGVLCAGTATITPTGTPPFEYSWSPGGYTTAIVTGLCAGTYSVYVTDRYARLCSPLTITVTTSAGLTVNSTASTSVLCNGGTTGSATVTVGAGASPYTYAWSNTQSTSAATGLGAGTYTVIVTDASGCDSTLTVSITQPPALTGTPTFTSTTCGQSNGTAGVSVGGGTLPYTYGWNTTPPQTTPTATALAAGNYSAMITDGNGCTQTASVSIAPSAGPNASLTAQSNVLCNGAGNGSAVVNASGGTAPYTYTWSPLGGNTTSASNLIAGTYTIVITDANKCTSTQSVLITEPLALIIGTAQVPDTCAANKGTATANPGGGTPAYTYAWSLPAGQAGNGQVNPTAMGLNKGTYTITITDANNCSNSTTVTVTDIPCPCPSNLDLTVPNAFSPNGDGQNDEFCLQGGANLEDCIRDVHITIFDRWGEKVYESTEKDFCWDGTYGLTPRNSKSTKVMNSAVYVYYMKATSTNNVEIIKEGNISLIR